MEISKIHVNALRIGEEKASWRGGKAPRIKEREREREREKKKKKGGNTSALCAAGDGS